MVSRPDLAPQAGLSRTDMERLQEAIADVAIFTDDHDIELEHSRGLDRWTADGSDPPLVAGVDQAFLDDRVISAIVVFEGESVIERVSACTELTIPYIPGLLAFREGGPILEAWSKLSVEPDLVLFDGSGRIHFREAGIATHIGVVLDIPAIGVAKSLLCGTPRSGLDDLPEGTRVAIEADSSVTAPAGTVIGYALQTRQYASSNRYINPLYVSPGHRVSAETAADIVLTTTAQYKLPEPTRLADAYADEVKRTYD